MRREIRKHEVQAPNYDPNDEPLMDVNRIRELLPHRYPMQLVDKVVETGSNFIVCQVFCKLRLWLKQVVCWY